MQRLTKTGLVTILSFFFLLSLSAETRHIHVIKMLDDNSQNFTISEGCRSIDYGVDQEVELMKFYLGITDVHYYHVSGTNFSRDRLQDVLDYELSYQERDIILLVYAGHGYREPSSRSRFPKLYFNNYDQAIEFEEIRLALIQKNPSLLISMVMACNKTQYDHNAPPPYLEEGNPPPPAVLTPKGVRAREPYLRLFADQPGYTKVLDLMSADREHYTFMTRDGGIFFSEILYTFQEIFTDLAFKTWPEVCRNISDRTVQRSLDRSLPQKPFCNYEIFLSSGPEIISQAPQSAYDCRANARSLRQQQRRELKALRNKHRTQMRSLRATSGQKDQRRLLAARQRSERADLKLRHRQNYQRSLARCR